MVVKNEPIKTDDFKTTEFDIEVKQVNDEEVDYIKDSVPQTLITCLDELQQNGKLISWKIRGHGENLTVKVTWNSKQNTTINDKKSNISTASSNNSSLSSILTPRLRKSSENISRKIENNQKIKNELNNFCSSLNKSLQAMKIKLFAKRNQEDYYKILSICKIELTSLITNILETLNLSLTNTNEKDKFENDIKLAIIEEIEKCLKFKTGTLKQILDKNTLNIENKTYPKVYEDLIAKAIIKKTEIDNLEKAIDAHDTFFDDFLSDLDEDPYLMYKTLKQKINENDNLFTTLNSIIKAKQKKESSINKNINNNNGSSKQSLEKCSNEEIDCKKVVQNWQDNWSFVEKKQENSNHSVVLTVPEPNEIISPIICHDDAEKLSEISLDVDNDELDNIENIKEIDEKSIDDDNFLNESEITINNSKSLEGQKFPIPRNILFNNSNNNNNNKHKQTKSLSSYYRPQDDRLESDIDDLSDDIEPTYKIFKKSNTQETSKKTNQIQVKDPLFVTRPENKLVRFGETAKIICKIEGTKPFNVNWYKLNGDELINNEKYELFHDDEYHYLKIYNTIKNDCGDYLCIVSNELNRNIDSFSLKLRDNNRLFKEPKFLMELKDLEVEEGYSATFKVKIDFGYPKCRVIFYRNNTLLLNDNKHEIYYCGDGVYHLHIPFVSDEDNAEYKCVLINTSNTIESKAELYVIEKENIKRPDTILKYDEETIDNTNNNDKEFIFSFAKSSTDSLSKSMSDLMDIKINQTETPSTLSYELLNEYDLINSNNNRYLNELAEEVVLKSISTTLELPNKKQEIIKKQERKKEDKISSSSQFSKTQSKKHLLNNQILNDHSLTLITKQSDNILSSSSYGSSIEPIHVKRNDLIKKELESKLNIKTDKVSLKSNSFISYQNDNHEKESLSKSMVNKFTNKIDESAQSNKNVELINEYNRLKIESVKERKKIWETEQFKCKMKPTRSFKKDNLKTTNENIKRKWSSLTNVIEYNSNIRKVNSDTNVLKQDIKNEINKLLKSEINLNSSRQSEANNGDNNRDECVSANEYMDENYDRISPKLKSDSNIVKKLKMKFDNKDQSFIKVASLTCRNVTKDILNVPCGVNGNQRTLITNRPMLSLYEPTSSIDIIDSSNFESNNNQNNFKCIDKLIDCNNLSQMNHNNPIVSSSSLSSLPNNNHNNNNRNNFNSFTSISSNGNSSQLSLNQSQLNNNTSSQSRDNLSINKTISFNNSIIDSNEQTKDSINIEENNKLNNVNDDYDKHIQNIVKDYKKLMNKNSRTKESSVLAKVRLWNNRVTWGAMD